MGGTQRSAKFVKYLPEFGWRPFVVTVKDVAYYARDLSLLDDVASAKVVRAGSLDPSRLLHLLAGRSRPATVGGQGRKPAGWLTKVLNWGFVPDPKVLWLPFAYWGAVRVLKSQNISCVLTTSPPHSIHLVGALLRKFQKVRWVADFRDGWTDGNFQPEPTALHRWLNRTLEARVLEEADAVVAVSAGLTKKLTVHCGGCHNKFHTITNGFDSADFSSSVNKTSKTVVDIVYCGALSNMAPLNAFLQGLKLFLESHPAMQRCLRVRLVGAVLDSTIEGIIASLSLQDVVELTGYCDHRKAIEYLRMADLLLYPVADEAKGEFVPGKTFEYLAAGKRILAIGPRVEGVKILEEFVPDLVQVAHDPALVARSLEKCLSVKAVSPRPSVAQFERRSLTGKLVQVLNG